jgi:hypothetical protein
MPPGIAGVVASLLRLLGHHCLGCNKQAGNRRRILEGGTNHLHGIDHTHPDTGRRTARLGVPAKCEVAVLSQLADDDRAFGAVILRDLAGGASWPGRTISTPTCWSALAVWTDSKAFAARSSATPPPGRMPSSTAARVAQRIVDAILPFLDLDFRGTANPDDGDLPPARMASRSCSFCGHSRGGLLDLCLDLRDLRIGPSSCARRDDRVFLFFHDDLLGATEHFAA